MMVALMIGSCGKRDIGAEHAIQYVKEQVPGLADDIESIEVTGVDTLLSDIWLVYEQVNFAKSGYDFLNDSLSLHKYSRMIDEWEQTIYDINTSWTYGMVVNDSLRKLEKYDGCWRRVYKILVTMKSGTTKIPRVLMDDDGITPRMIERDFENKMNEWMKKTQEARDNIKFKTYNY